MTRESNGIREAGQRPTSSYHVLVVGGGPVGLATAEHLAKHGDAVTFVGEVADRDSDESDVSILPRSPRDAADVRDIGNAVRDVDAVVAVGRDSRSLYVAHLCQREFTPAVAVATLNDPGRRVAFRGTGVEPIPVSELLARRISRHVREGDT